MGNQNTKNNMGLGDGQAASLTCRLTKGQKRKLRAVARAAGLDVSRYIRRQLGLEGHGPAAAAPGDEAPRQPG